MEQAAGFVSKPVFDVDFFQRGKAVRVTRQELQRLSPDKFDGIVTYVSESAIGVSYYNPHRNQIERVEISAVDVRTEMASIQILDIVEEETT